LSGTAKIAREHSAISVKIAGNVFRSQGETKEGLPSAKPPPHWRSFQQWSGSDLALAERSLLPREKLRSPWISIENLIKKKLKTQNQSPIVMPLTFTR
jgi:hypothetical protein